ncbi:MAG TPA: hypothetical protein VF057_01815 [Thermoanaerobaculia bacterium]
MARINWRRVAVSGLLWAAVYSIVGGIAMLLFLGREFIAELERLGRPLALDRESLISLGLFGIVFTLAWGVIAMWFYAAIRPRYGPGPRTAIIAAIGVWLLTIAAPVSHLAAFGMASSRFVMFDLPTELVAIIAATVAGAWLYKE